MSMLLQPKQYCAICISNHSESIFCKYIAQKFIHPDMFGIYNFFVIIVISYLNISAPFIEQLYVTYNSTRLQGYYISLRELQIQIISSMLLCINCFLLRVNCFFIFDMFCVSSCLIAIF